MDTQLLCFVTEKSTSFTNEIDIPSAGGMDASCKGGYTPDIADTKGTIFVLLVTVSAEYVQATTCSVTTMDLASHSVVPGCGSV